MTAASPDPSTRNAPRRAGAAWFTLFTLAWLAIWTAQLTPLQLLIPLQLNTPGDADRWISGVVSSGLILAAGGLAGVLAGPLAGGMSDRTRGAFGRRRPWALGGVVLGAVSLIGLAFATGPWAVAMSWIGVSVGVAVASAAFTAMIADQLTEQRGTASASISSSQALGVVVGVGVIVLLGLGVIAGYLVLGGVLLIAGGLGALLLPDPPAPAASATARTRLAAAERFAAFRDRDFAWMLWGRLVVNIGNALGTGLLLFFLLYGLHRDPTGAQDSAPTSCRFRRTALATWASSPSQRAWGSCARAAGRCRPGRRRRGVLAAIPGQRRAVGGRRTHDPDGAGGEAASIVASATSITALKTRGRIAVTRCEVRGTTMSSAAGTRDVNSFSLMRN
ncbi:Major Facilitator Superfamily protein [Microbacterium laevaniformans]|uniref:Major Facilitator Superfamily protein n=1 Tax=Microbacterium laevaniformans TaxID=36807 RepID=A0A150HDT5_9MICO|nr:Major Facilitator Superfamily protein [Microbacterium laevaniformans]